MGSQEPYVRVVPDYVYTDGPDSVAICEAGGLILDDWQCQLQNDWLGRNSFGRWVSAVCGLSVPRQNGKTANIEGRSNFGMLALSEWIIYTAHLQKTATETFEEMANFFETRPMTKYVKDIKTALGREQIILKNNGRIKFVARTRNGGRGLHGDLLIFDEAQELTSSQQAGFLPAISASKNPQTIYIGTPPDENCDGSVFRKIRSDAINGRTQKTSWSEWSIPEIGDVKDKKIWALTNPALGKRINLSTIEGEQEQMDEDTFARERLGWWADNVTGGLFDLKEWSDLAVTFTPEQIEAQKEWKIAFGVKFSIDGARASISVATWQKGEIPHIECLISESTENGIGWVVDFFNSRWGKASVIVIDGKANASDLFNRLVSDGVNKRALKLATVDIVTASSSMFVNAVSEGNLSHNAQPKLDKAIKMAQKREVGKGGGYGFKADEQMDITPLESASLALWGVRTSRRNPKRKMRIG